jgi:hypothetical protein
VHWPGQKAWFLIHTAHPISLSFINDSQGCWGVKRSQRGLPDSFLSSLFILKCHFWGCIFFFTKQN